MKPAEVLRKAKALIEERGWAQGLLVSGTGACCAEGAIGLATCGDAEGPDTGCLELMSQVTGDCLHLWNDAHCRTKAEVLDAFDRAIAIALAEAAQS